MLKAAVLGAVAFLRAREVICEILCAVQRRKERDGMRKASFTAGRGEIVYWVSDAADVTRPWVVFLPGLTADRRLFALRSSTSRAVSTAPRGTRRPMVSRARFRCQFSRRLDLAPLVGGDHEGRRRQHPCSWVSRWAAMWAQVFRRAVPGARLRHRVGGFAPLGRDYYKRWELARLPCDAHVPTCTSGTLKKTSTEGNAATPEGHAIKEPDPFRRLRERGVPPAFRPWVRHAGRRW